MTAAIGLASIAFVLILLFIYPYLLYPTILATLPARKAINRATPATSRGEQYALLFCAYNEARSAMDKLENIRQLKERYPDLEVLVFDDGSTDGTPEMFGQDPAAVRLIKGSGRQGKAHGMKVLAAATNREFLVFTDANVMLDTHTVDALAGYFVDPTVGGVCGHLEYLSESETATEAVGDAYWSLDERLKKLESTTGNVMGGDGSIFAVRRELYPDFPDTVQDDFTVTMAVVFAGKRLVYAPDVIAREKLVSSRKEEYRRKVRIAARAFHTFLCMRADLVQMTALDRWKFMSHKFLRWLGGFVLVAAMLTSIAAAALVFPMATVLAVAAVLLGIILGRKISKRIDAIVEVFVALVATSHGVLLAIRGTTFQTWAPATTR